MAKSETIQKEADVLAKTEIVTSSVVRNKNVAITETQKRDRKELQNRATNIKNKFNNVSKPKPRQKSSKIKQLKKLFGMGFVKS